MILSIITAAINAVTTSEHACDTKTPVYPNTFAMMLRFQQIGMTFMSVSLISTCVCQAVGNAGGAFVLSISRQGVIRLTDIKVIPICWNLNIMAPFVMISGLSINTLMICGAKIHMRIVNNSPNPISNKYANFRIFFNLFSFLAP